jgi:methionine-rich copper-binding protein CopC
MKAITFAIVMLFSLTTPCPAPAHSILMESTPKHGALLTAPPSAVILRFNAKIEPAMTRIALVDDHKHRQPLEPSAESTVDRIIVRVPPLGPGVYTVVYKVLATDGHVTQGSIRFTIRAS